MTSLPVATPRYATGLDAAVYGVHIVQPEVPRFTTPLTRTLVAPGRLHLYAGWASPGSHRATIVWSLLELQRVMSVSYVDMLRDARGWAFREASGADDVNGFTLLREAYEWTSPGYDGPVTVPVLWDRHESRIVSNDPDGIDLGLATTFDGRHGVSLYPAALRSEIYAIDRWIERDVTTQLGLSAVNVRTRDTLLAAFATLSAHLASRRYLVGDALTIADVRLWVSLARYDAGPNAHGLVGPKLDSWEHLWSYARQLYQLPAFRDSTRFDAIAAPFAALPNW